MLWFKYQHLCFSIMSYAINILFFLESAVWKQFFANWQQRWKQSEGWFEKIGVEIVQKTEAVGSIPNDFESKNIYCSKIYNFILFIFFKIIETMICKHLNSRQTKWTNQTNEHLKEIFKYLSTFSWSMYSLKHHFQRQYLL